MNGRPNYPRTTDKPPHPLVIDATTLLCRYATQDDVNRMETICKSYEQLIQDARQTVERAEALKVRLDMGYTDG